MTADPVTTTRINIDEVMLQRPELTSSAYVIDEQATRRPPGGAGLISELDDRITCSDVIDMEASDPLSLSEATTTEVEIT